VGVNIRTKTLLEDFDAIVLCGGSTVPRDLPIKGRHFKGVHFAMEFLSQQNKRKAAIDLKNDHSGNAYLNGEILATNKNVLVIGGGDTGSDCVGTSNRQQAKSVTQIELMPMPPKQRAETTPWPQYPMMLRTSTSHEEGCERKWAIQTKEFIGDENGNLKALKTVEIEWKVENGKMISTEIPNTEKDIPCELVLLAMGFVNPQYSGMLEDFGVVLDERNNVKAQNYQTNNPKIFTAGDMRRGQSLVVWAISEGREAAREVDLFLMGHTALEAKEISMLQVQK
jgi:glutamate synthase (NADPH/NADH) small chain